MQNDKNSHRYDDIIDLPHPVSPVHPRMSMSDRAAQFAPFAALTGHDAQVKEAARLTCRRIELSEDSRLALDQKQQLLLDSMETEPTVSVTYFVPDEKKDGGEYITVTGQVQKLDPVRRVLVLSDGTRIRLSEIIDLESSLF